MQFPSTAVLKRAAIFVAIRIAVLAMVIGLLLYVSFEGAVLFMLYLIYIRLLRLNRQGEVFDQ